MPSWETRRRAVFAKATRYDEMMLSVAGLEAFFAIAQAHSFTKAARRLHLTQSTLSHRIRQLETQIGAAVFVRHEAGAKLTEAGERLMAYCQMRETLDREYLTPFVGKTVTGHRGILRVAGYSTVMRPLVLPALAPFIRSNPAIHFEFACADLRELPSRLLTGASDIVLTDSEIKRPPVESKLIGEEVYVLVESRKHGGSPEIYLDNDHEDATTTRFFEQQREKPSALRRSYLDDIFAIVDSVALGLGRAVVPRHMLAAHAELRLVPGYIDVSVPVYLNYLVQPYHSKMHIEARELISTGLATLLRAHQVTKR